MVDITGSPQFGVRVLFWSEGTAVSSVNNTGMGDNDLGDSLALIEDGNVLLRGQVRRDLFPFPTTLKDSSGTVTFTYDLAGPGRVAIKMVATFRFDRVEIKHAEKTDTMWEITLGGQRISALTPTGFQNNGTQSTSTARVASNKYLYQERSKVYDPATVGPIVDSSRQSFNLWGVSADTDAAELTAIATILAAWNTPPQAREKVYDATVQRLSSSVVRIHVVWKQLNSQDSIQVPAHMVRVDPWDLHSMATSAVVYALSSTIPVPVPPSGLKLSDQTQNQLNMFLSVDKRVFEKNDSKDKLELPATVTVLDPSSLNSHATVGTLNATTSTLTGFLLRETSAVQLTAAGTPHWFATSRFGLRTTKEDAEFPGTSIIFDYWSINSNARVTIISDGTASTPTISGLKVVDRNTHRLTDTGGSTGKYETTFVLNTRDTFDQITGPRTHSSRAADRPYRDETATIIASATINEANLANVLWQAFQQVAYADGLTVSYLADGKHLVVYEYNNPGATVQGHTRSATRWVNSRCTSGTTTQIYCITNGSYSSNTRIMEFSRVLVQTSTVREFVLFRQLQGTTIPEQYPSTINGLALPAIGQINSAAFLGIAAGLVIFDGPRYKVNIGLSTNGVFPIAIGYAFRSDSLGFVDYVPDHVFTRPWYVTTSDTNSSPHWANVSLLGLPDVAAPSTASFAAFTSGISV